jgi:hypothetical protein
VGDLGIYPKPIRKLIRLFLAEAYQREQHALLAQLDRSFTEWREGRLDNEALNERIHQYHDKSSRELYKRYNGGFPDLLVAYAFETGILNPKEAPAELLEALADRIRNIRQVKEQESRSR